MKAGNLLDALPGEHQDPYGAGIGRMNGCIGTLEPTVKAHEFVFVEPPRADDLRLRWDARGGVIDKPEASRRCAAIVMFRLHAPGIRRMNVTANVIRHRPRSEERRVGKAWRQQG